MNILRTSKLIACLVLAWFALFLGAAVASTAMKAGSMQMVCSGGGMKLVDVDGNDGGKQSSANMDCPLCPSVAPPPPHLQAFLAKPSGLAHALHPIAAAHIAAATAPPLPSRGPPTFVL
jgi:hypothetical protein